MPRLCQEKGQRFIKSAGRCMTSCKKGSYRSKTSPFYCRHPTRKNRTKCPAGMKRSQKSKQCVPKFKMLTYSPSRRRR